MNTPDSLCIVHNKRENRNRRGYNLGVMRSQAIKVKNLPEWKSAPRSIHLKPVFLLSACAAGGIVLLANGVLRGLALILIIIPVFAILMMPDRILMQFSPEYAVLYNYRAALMCTILYWEDLVEWQYEYHNAADIVSFSLVDGSVQQIEMFSRRPVARCMEQFAPGKEIRSSRRKEHA